MVQVVNVVQVVRVVQVFRGAVHPKRRQIFANIVGRICKLNLTQRLREPFRNVLADFAR